MEELLKSLAQLVALHRQLLQIVQTEHEAVVAADLKMIESTTEMKQDLIRDIRLEETNRIRLTQAFVETQIGSGSALTASLILSTLRKTDPEHVDEFLSLNQGLGSLIQQIKEQNLSNSVLLEKSIHHIQEMKKNILSESVPHASTYTQQGQCHNAARSSRPMSTYQGEA